MLDDAAAACFSHPVGMAVHDDGGYSFGPAARARVLGRPADARPGGEAVLRYEDTVVVTETGVENFTDFLPSELDDLEALARERGIVQAFPPDRR